MNYCKKCHILCEDSICPHCGSKYVRLPEPEDYVFLVEKEYPWSEMLEGALREEGFAIAVNEAVAGAWITTRLGAGFERHHIFVPYKDLDQAREIVHQMFDNPEFVDFEETDTE